MHRPIFDIHGLLGALAASMPTGAQLAGIVPSAHRPGRGIRSIDSDHRRIRDAATRDTPGAERMREVVDRRRANWSPHGATAR